jgi:hypothetical protein
MAVIGTMTTGAAVVSTFSLTYLPEQIFFVAATQLTALKVEVLGEGVICDLDAAGINALGRSREISAVTNGFAIQLADGLIKGKNVTITATNSAAQTPTLYAIVRNAGRLYVNSSRQQLFANSPIDLDKFLYLALPNLGATDAVNITYQDGTTSNTNRAEMQYIATLSENVQNTASDYVIDNYEQDIKAVNITQSTTASIYIQKFQAA